MKQVSIREAKTNFSKYLAMLRNDEENEVVICLRGVPCARLQPIAPSFSQGLRFGTARKYISGKSEGDPNFGDREIEQNFDEKGNEKW